MYKARIKIALQEDWSKHFLRKFSYSLRSIHCSHLNAQQVLDIIVINAPQKEHQHIQKFLTKEKTIHSLEILESAEHYLIITVITKYHTIISRVLKHRCFMIDPTIHLDATAEYWIIGAKEKSSITASQEQLDRWNHSMALTSPL